MRLTGGMVRCRAQYLVGATVLESMEEWEQEKTFVSLEWTV